MFGVDIRIAIEVILMDTHNLCFYGELTVIKAKILITIQPHYNAIFWVHRNSVIKRLFTIELQLHLLENEHLGKYKHLGI